MLRLVFSSASFQISFKNYYSPQLYMVRLTIIFSTKFQRKIISLFRTHGAVECVTPLLSPFVKSTKSNAVRLMTHSGSVVVLPHDLRIPFIKHVALSGLSFVRRYSVGRVYREKKVFNFHPKQLYECAFDVITPTPTSHISEYSPKNSSIFYRKKMIFYSQENSIFCS